MRWKPREITAKHLLCAALVHFPVCLTVKAESEPPASTTGYVRLATDCRPDEIAPFASVQDRRCVVERFERLLQSSPAQVHRMADLKKEFADSDELVGYIAQVLDDQGRSGAWSLSVSTLGAVGSLRSLDLLKEYLQRPVDPSTGKNLLSPNAFQARVDALHAIGYTVLAATKPEVRKLADQFLDSLVSPECSTWVQLEWTSPIHKSPEQRNLYMANRASQISSMVREKRSASEQHAMVGIQETVASNSRVKLQ